MNNKILTLITAIVIAIVIWVSMTFYDAYQPKAPVLQGEIDAQSYNISSKLPGRISKIFVKKGDFIHKGDIVFTIASPEMEAKLAQAKAAEDAAGAQKDQAETGARKQEIQAAEYLW
jgi:HlyD family secretion protein